MPKPAQTAAWATLASYPDGVEVGTDTKTEPSADRKAEGWEPAAKPAAQTFNWWWNLVGQWTEYLDAGVLEGDHTIDGALLVDSNAGISGDLGVGGTTSTVDLAYSGELHHPDITIVQGFEGGLGSFSSGISSGVAIFTLGPGAIAYIPIKAPLIPGLSRIKKVELVVENNTLPTLSLAAQDQIPPGSATINVLTQSSTLLSGGTHTRVTGTASFPVPSDVRARHLIKIENNAGTDLKCFNIYVTYDAIA